MRRVLLPAALLVAVALLLTLGPPWGERAGPQRVGHAPAEGAASGRPAGASAATPAASADAAPAEATACVHGVVTGAMDVLWGARVVAYRLDSDDVIADTYTNPRGEYLLVLAAGVDFDLAVEPNPETYLVSIRRRALVVAVGEDREENFSLAPTANICGKLVDQGGNGLGGLELLAVRPEDVSADPTAHPNALLGREVGRCRTHGGGAFRLGCLAAGRLAIVIRDPEWTLPAPTMIATGGPEATLVAVPAMSVDLLVLDIETGEPVEAFSAKLSIADWRGLGEPQERRVVLEGAGSDGVFSRRLPVDPLPRVSRSVELDITANGFVPWTGGVTRRARQEVWLLPVREENATIRVLFDDGQPYRGSARVDFEAKSGRGDGVVPFERVEDGQFRGAMPRGQWVLQVWPQAVFGYPLLKADVDVTADVEAQVKFVLPAGGALVLRPPPGDGVYGVNLRNEDEDDAEREGSTYAVPAEGTRIEGIPPGAYKIGYRNFTIARILETRQIPAVTWFRDVRVEAGRTEEITLPSE